MKFNDLATGTITRFDDEGRGVFDVILGDGISKRPFSVPFTTIGDAVEARCIRRIRGRFIGELQNVMTPGPSRREEFRISSRSTRSNLEFRKLPYAPWMHIDYEDQLIFKRDLINRSFENAGHAERVAGVIAFHPPHATTPPALRTTHNAPRTTQPYRNRMDFCFGWKGELGMKELGSWNRYVDLDDCLLMEGSEEILRVFHEFMRAFPDLKPWDAKKHVGDLRYVLVRRGTNSGDGIVALVVKDLSRITEEMRAWLVERAGKIIKNVCLSENPLITDLSYGQTIIPLQGRERFEEIINGTRYAIHLNSFFQTNSTMAAVLQDTVYEMAAGYWPLATGQKVSASGQRPVANSLLDLYCGLGFFGIDFARRDLDLRMSGFEIDEHAIALANENAAANGVADRCAFKSGKAEDLSWKEIDAEVCIIDPPRAGLHPKVLETLIERRYPRLIYVSCKYQRLVEELKLLKTAYDIKEIRALDLFPHTPHVEVVVKMNRK
jgi:tRNA/tmRNA/rRNA uracil-C5-methylase (TrmA/RlmC/RlmD family)